MVSELNLDASTPNSFIHRERLACVMDALPATCNPTYMTTATRTFVPTVQVRVTTEISGGFHLCICVHLRRELVISMVHSMNCNLTQKSCSQTIQISYRKRYRILTLIPLSSVYDTPGSASACSHGPDIEQVAE